MSFEGWSSTVCSMPCIVVDVEATCWVDRSARPRDEMEIIEIGAVRLAEDLGIVDEFSSFVRPVVHPQLTDFCTELTTITQADVDNAEPFAAVFARFLTWIGEGPHRLCSWGAYDLNQFRLDCRRAGAAFPEWFETGHVNLKAEFATWRVVKRCGMARALTQLDLPLEGIHHRGIDDARNIARIAQQVLPHVGGKGLSSASRV